MIWKVTIQSLEVQDDEGVTSSSEPDWEGIETALRSLEDRAARIELWEGDESSLTVVVTGSPGFYAVDVIDGQKTAAMLVNPLASSTSYVEVFGDDCREDQIVSDLELVVKAVRHLLETRKYWVPQESSVVWEHRNI